jgi:hypothetical protein
LHCFHDEFPSLNLKPWVIVFPFQNLHGCDMLILKHKWWMSSEVESVLRLFMPPALDNEGQGAWDKGMEFDGTLMSAEFIGSFRVWGGEPTGEPNLSAMCRVRVPKIFRSGRSPTLQATRYSPLTWMSYLRWWR